LPARHRHPRNLSAGQIGHRQLRIRVPQLPAAILARHLDLGLLLPRENAHEVVVAITDGQLDFGTWERIFYGEFDGRRRKRVLVKIIGE